MSLRAQGGVFFTAVSEPDFSGRGAGRFLAHYVRVGMTADRNDREIAIEKAVADCHSERREESIFLGMTEG